MFDPPSESADGEQRGKVGAQGEPSFLDRHTLGLSHWLWIAIALTLAVAFIPRGARRAIESNTNKAEDWLPDNYAESADLRWFRDHFVGEAFALVSWDGCTLGDTQRLELLRRKLLQEKDKDGWAWFPHVVSGPDTIDNLITGPASLERSAALSRLEGALVGPPKRGPDGESLGDASRTTCLIAYLDDRLTDNNRRMRVAVERIQEIAHVECGIPLADLHMGGPPVDNVTIDIEGEKTLIRLAGLAGIVGLSLSFLCFRSWKLTGMVFWAAVVSAGMSLALVFYFGVLEVFAFGMEAPRFGKTDAILMSMPAVVYVLALSGAIHLVNYYREEREAHGIFGAAERAVRVAWGPCLLAAFTTAVGLGSLGSSDILPIQKFGVFTAIGVLVAVALLFSILPLLLHGFPPKDQPKKQSKRRRGPATPWYTPLARFVTTRHRIATTVCLLFMAFFAAGLPQIRTSVKLLKLLDPNCDLITDYAWLEENLGNLVPMEVIIALDGDRLRAPGDPAVSDGSSSYRMTMFERSQLIRRLQEEVESLEPVSRALSAATFSVDPPDSGSASLQRSVEFTTAQKLEESRESLSEYLRPEFDAEGEPTGRELWRVSARVTALSDVDYGEFVQELRGRVEPVLATYAARDEVVKLLQEQGKELSNPREKLRVCLLSEGADESAADAELMSLLKRSAGNAKGFQSLNVNEYAERDDATRAKLCERLAGYDLVAATEQSVADAFRAASPEESAPSVTLLGATATDAALPATEATAVYTGVVPLVYKTQRELLVSLRESIGWATVLIAGVMVVVLRSPFAGLASMIPNVFPIVMVFGALGWMGVKVDIGIMMTASVALGVAVDDTLHFVTWFGRGVRSGLDRRSATLLAFQRCATAMTQTTLIAGLGLAVFAASTFTPTQQFGTLMITMLGAALIGDLILLPALLCGPLGRFFAPGAPAVPVDGTDDHGPGASSDSQSNAGPKQNPEEGPEAIEEEPSEGGPAVIPFPPSAESASMPEQSSVPPPHTKRPEEPLSPENESLRQRLERLRRSSS